MDKYKKQDTDTQSQKTKEKLQLALLKADVFEHYINAYGKLVGVIGLTVTTISQIALTIAKMFSHKTHAIMKSARHIEDSGYGLGGGGLVSAIPSNDSIFNFFTTPQYGIFVLMIVFGAMIFIKKRKKHKEVE